jgi:hypothetical protein
MAVGRLAGSKRWQMKGLSGTVVVLGMILAMPNANAGSPDPLFQDDAPLRVEISAPFSRLINERPKDREFPGGFSFRDSNGAKIELDVQVRARGRFRHRNCDFPPLFLNFKRSQVGGTLFDQQNKLKMVVHCKDSLRYQQSVLREYLAYRMLNALTDRSFRVRLLDVTYVDSEDRRPRIVRNAFLIEHENRLADRLGMRELNIFPDGVGALQADHLNLTSVFQYLLGNTDFSPILGSDDECCHNYVLFGADDSPLVAIPYDFDMSGFVNAPYAMPREGLDIDNVRQRLYQGFCVNNRHVDASIAEVLQAREALHALVAGLQALEPSVRQHLAGYMNEFFETIGDSQSVQREMLDQCVS